MSTSLDRSSTHTHPLSLAGLLVRLHLALAALKPPMRAGPRGASPLPKP